MRKFERPRPFSVLKLGEAVSISKTLPFMKIILNSREGSFML